MTTLMIPPNDRHPWPTLGPQVVSWMESHLVFGPGDLRGQPYRLDDEKTALLYRMYEVFPHSDINAGRRRFSRAGLSLRKGVAKSELAAAVAAVELAPDGPVRCDGWRRQGSTWVPVGAPVTDPYIAMVAFTEEQSDELAFASLRVMLGEGPRSRDYDIGLERVTRSGGDGRAVSLAGAPSSRDGARTTFQVVDESHRWTSERLRQAHRTMLANLPKRRAADAWSLEVTTAYEPGARSVAEATMDYARGVARGEIADSRLFFFHRQASDSADLSTPSAIRAAVIDASGPAASWSNIDAIVDQWQDPKADRSYLERVWLNRPSRGSSRAFDSDIWDRCIASGHRVPDEARITLGFDGSRKNDATALIATEIETGYQWSLGIWSRPVNADETWRVPVAEVDAAVSDAFGRYDVWRLYADPPYWETMVGEWAGRFGRERVIEWWTNRPRAFAYAILAWRNAVAAGDVSHDADPVFSAHVANACRRPIGTRDEDGEPLWVVEKVRPESPDKIDAVVAAVLSWDARMDAITSGVLNVEPAWVSVYDGLTADQVAERMSV